MPHNLITLPRSQFYELVWSKPVRDLAADFSISDVALAKRCRALKIPVPPRGYWARVAAGQKPRRPALPPFTERKRAMLPSYVTTRAANGTVAIEPAVTFDPERTAPRAPAGLQRPGEAHRSPLQAPATRGPYLHPRRNHRSDPAPRGLT